MVDAFESLAHIPSYWAQRNPTGQAVVTGLRPVSYDEFARKVVAVASCLEALGVGTGECVAYLGRNDEAQLLLFFACASRGLRLTLPNWRLSPGEVHDVLVDANVSAIFATSECAPLLAGYRPGDGVHLVTADMLLAAAEHPLCSSVAAVPVVGSTDLILCYTSGSTGKPKGVRQTHGNWMAAIRSAAAWAGGGWHEGTRALCTLPFFHVAGLRSAVLAIAFGGTAVFPENGAAGALVDLIQRERITTMSVVPTVLKTLLDVDDEVGRKLASLETVFYGGTPMPTALLAQARSTLSCAFVQTYGATETTGMVLALDDAHHSAPCNKLHSCGKPLPGIRIEIRSASGQRLEPGESGHIWLGGPSIANGYWKQDLATAQSFVDGWFCPGDLGRLDTDGFLMLEGRSSDVIKSGGEKVFPSEVERVILTHPAVEDAAVYGLPDEKWGERVCATVVLTLGSNLSESDVVGFCRGKIAAFKVPRQIDFVAALPRNAGGKVLRSVLKSERSDSAGAG